MATKMGEKELEALDINSIKKRFTQQRAESAYIESHYDDLLKEHRNRWVIISEGKLVQTERNPDRLLETLKTSKRKGLLVYYVHDPGEVMLL